MKRSVVGAVITASLLLAPLAYAQTAPVPIGDPYTDTIQLWSEIASAISSLGNDFAALFRGQQSATNAPSTPQQQTASLAEAVASFETPSATSSESTTTTATSDQTTISQNVNPAEFASVDSIPTQTADIFSNPTPAFNAAEYVTQSELAASLLSLSNSLASKFTSTTTPALPQSVAADGNPVVPYAAENNIGNLSNVTITNANLTASEIPALDYLSLSGGTLSGTLNVPSLNASSTNYGVITSTDASSTLLSNFGTAYFGGTATTTIDSAGDVNVGGSLTADGNVTLGNATSTNFFATTASTTNLFANSGSFAWLEGAAFSALSTNYLPDWNNGAWVNSLIDDNGASVGIGTTSPAATFAVNGSGYFSGNLSVAGNISGTYLFTQTGTGATAEPITTTVGRIIYADQFGTAHNGTTDDTAALQDALNAASAEGGGTVYLGPYQYLINSANLSIPNNVTLSGEWGWAGNSRPNTLNYIKQPYTLLVNSSHTIDLEQGSALQNVIVLESTLPTPSSTRSALNAIEAFSGTGVTMDGTGAALRDALIIGFNECIGSAGTFPNLVIQYVYGDCNNGLTINNSYDVSKLNDISFDAYYSKGVSGGAILSWPITNAVNNGSGEWEIDTSATTANLPLQTGDTVWVTGAGGAFGANGKWIATVVNATTIDLRGSEFTGPTVNATTTLGYSLVSVASSAGIAVGQTVSGSGISSGTTVSEVSGMDVYISSPAISTNDNTPLSFTNGSYTSGGTLYVDLGERPGTAFTITNSDGTTCTDCFEYGYNVGFDIAAGADFTVLTDASADGDQSLQDPTTISFEEASTSSGTVWQGGYTSSSNTALNVDTPNTTSTSAGLSVSGVDFGNLGVLADIDSGNVTINTSETSGNYYILVGQYAGHLNMAGDNFQNSELIPASVSAQSTAVIGGGTVLGSGTPLAGLPSYASPVSGLTGAGMGALTNYVATSTSGETAFGYQALGNATSSSDDVAIGYRALQGSLTVSSTGNNTAVGWDALTLNASGEGGVAMGFGALSKNSTGNYNTAIGFEALLSNTTASANVAIGASALWYNQGANNTAVGYKAGQGASGNAGSFNALFGFNSGFAITTGAGNLFVGANTASTTATGSNNIALGYDIALPATNGSNQLDIGNLIYGTGVNGQGPTLSTGDIGIGTASPYSRLQVTGPDTASSTSAFAVVSSASTTLFSVFDGGNAELSGSLSQSSDQRLKTNIQPLDASSSLSLIEELNPVTFNWIDPEKGTTPQLGFIAQQVQLVFPNLVSTTSATALTPDGTLSLNYIGLISPIVSAIQEISSELTSLENTVAGFAQSFTSAIGNFGTVNTQQLCVGSTCVTPAKFQAMVAAANVSQSSGQGSSEATSDDSQATDTPPVIQINGDNPAIVQVGAAYNDLGATITGPQADLNLGITTYLNGTLTSNIVIDTSQAATDTIDYVATDQNGLTATSTRTVIIEPAESPSIIPTDDASTSTPTDATETDDAATSTSPVNVATTTDATSTAQ